MHTKLITTKNNKCLDESSHLHMVLSVCYRVCMMAHQIVLITSKVKLAPLFKTFIYMYLVIKLSFSIIHVLRTF